VSAQQFQTAIVSFKLIDMYDSPAGD